MKHAKSICSAALLLLSACAAPTAQKPEKIPAQTTSNTQVAAGSTQAIHPLQARVNDLFDTYCLGHSTNADRGAAARASSTFLPPRVLTIGSQRITQYRLADGTRGVLSLHGDNLSGLVCSVGIENRYGAMLYDDGRVKR